MRPRRLTTSSSSRKKHFLSKSRRSTFTRRTCELIAAGVYNEWIEKSLDKLALLVPGRYAKSEVSSGFVSSIDIYAYRSPSAPTPNLITTTEGEAAPEADAVGYAAEGEPLDGERVRQAAAPEVNDVRL